MVPSWRCNNMGFARQYAMFACGGVVMVPSWICHKR